MPWQMAPPLIIIFGAFTATGLLLQATDQFFLGRNKRVMIDDYVYRMDKRDERIADAKYAKASEEERKKMPPITRMYRF